MNNYIKAFIVGASLFSLTACNDYLNEEPVDKILPENYFNQASNLQAYTLNFYTMFPSHSDNAFQLGTFSSDNGTDNQAALNASTMWVPGEWRVSDESENWNFEKIRQLNYFFQYAQPNYDEGLISGTPSLVDQAMGEAHFFLAFAYWQGYSAIGDYPILDGVLPQDKEALLAASIRQPRNKVARYILTELDKAINLLPEASTYGKNGLNKDCARLLRSRVALFEGTWLKYHKGTALVPGGKDWPGDKNLLDGFNIDDEIKYFLTEAKKSAKDVADKYYNNLVANNGNLEALASGLVENNPYAAMFCVSDVSKYSEVLLARSYSTTLNITTQIQAQFQKNAGGTGWTRSLVNAFVMENGLPIYDAASGYDANWENTGITTTLQNRDSRIRLFTKQDTSIVTYGADGNTPGKWRMGWLLEGTHETKSVTGFAIKKGQGFNFNEAMGNYQSYTASIIFRSVEALLNYMEANYELDGQIDENADKYWRAIRKRARINEDYNVTIAATNVQKEAEFGDWGAYSHNQLVSPTLYNVRRERRCELIGEALRLMDVRRWAALDQMITTPYIVEGIKYWNTCYSDSTSTMPMLTDKGTFAKPVLYTETEDGSANISGPAQGDYVRPYQRTKNGNLVWDGYTFTPAHYLSPIGHAAFVNASPDKDPDNSVIYQNPGWSKDGGKGATKIEH